MLTEDYPDPSQESIPVHKTDILLHRIRNTADCRCMWDTRPNNRKRMINKNIIFRYFYAKNKQKKTKQKNKQKQKPEF